MDSIGICLDRSDYIQVYIYSMNGPQALNKQYNYQTAKDLARLMNYF